MRSRLREPWVLPCFSWGLHTICLTCQGWAWEISCKEDPPVFSGCTAYATERKFQWDSMSHVHCDPSWPLLASITLVETAGQVRWVGEITCFYFSGPFAGTSCHVTLVWLIWTVHLCPVACWMVISPVVSEKTACWQLLNSAKYVLEGGKTLLTKFWCWYWTSSWQVAFHSCKRILTYPPQTGTLKRILYLCLPGFPAHRHWLLPLK
jgi:hypothetical protein